MTRFTTVSDPDLSLWLSAVHEVVQVRNHPLMQAAVQHAQISSLSSDPLNPLLSSFDDPLAHISHLTFVLANALIHNMKSLEDEVEEKLFRLYSDRDPHWAEIAIVYKAYYRRGREPHYHSWTVEGHNNPNYSVIPNRLKNDAKVGLIADWGTGMPDAAKLVEAMLGLNVDAIIHLGDVYYAGTDKEFQHHIVETFEQVFAETGKRVPVFSIPGNHDYYAGAKGFYEKSLSLNSRSYKLETGWQQEASYFCLRTQDDMWQFLGMDTGLHGHSLEEDKPSNPLPPYVDESEIEWHHDKLNAQNFQGTTILLSHHQLFSQHNRLTGGDANQPWLNPHLWESFHAYFDRVAAWFWGHEHNLALFKDGLFDLSKGRLIGCSAYEESGNPYAPVNLLYTEQVPYINDQADWRVSASAEDPKYYNHAFAILDFARKDALDPIRCTYYMFPSWGETPPTICQPTELYSEDIHRPS